MNRAGQGAEGRGAPTRTSTDPTLRLHAGSLLAGRYRIVGVLGAGGMGLVYEARDEELGLDVAVKVLRPELHGDGLERFRRELVLARQVSHAGVVRIHDLGRDGELHFLTMDLVRGRSLRELLEGGALEPARAVAIATQLADALAAAHREGVVHRDLKPANVLVAEGDRAYVSDFGIARSLGAAGLTRTGEVVGTPDYLAPEQARGDMVDHRADLYALGLILYEMLTGELPFPSGSFAELVAQRIAGRARELHGPGAESPRLREIVARLLQNEPRRRYQSAEEVALGLRRFDESLPLWRRPLWRRLGIAAAAVAIVAAAGVAWLRRSDAPQAERDGPAAAAPAGLAVLPFADETATAELAWLGGGLAEMLARSLAESPDLLLVDTERVAQTLRDLSLEPGRLEPASRRQLAELFDARRLIAGRVRVLGEQLLAEVELFDVTSGADAGEVSRATASAPAAELPRLVSELGREVRRLLEVPVPAHEPPLSLQPAALAAYAEGVRLLRRGEAVAAAPRLEAAVAADPEFGAAWHELAAARQALGYREPARDAADRAVSLLQPSESMLAWEARAQQAQLRGDSEETRRILEELVTRFPNSVTSAVRLAEAYGESGNLTGAVERLRSVVGVDPNHPRAWFLLGKYSILAGDSRRAVDEYLVRAMVIQNKLRSPQGRADVLNAFGVAYLDLAELDRADEHYRQAAALRLEIGDRRGYATSLRNLGLVATYRLEYDEAARLLGEALEILEEVGDPAGVADLHNELGILEEERARYAVALEHYRLSLQGRRELGDERALAESLNNVGYSYFLVGELDHAEGYWRQALELFVQNANREGEAHARQGLGELQLARGQWAEATRSFLAALELARAIETPAGVAAARGAMGQVAQLEGRFAAALDSYHEALEVLGGLEDLRGLVEFTLAEAEANLELGLAERAVAGLDRAEPWLKESQNHEHLAELARLRARSHADRGDSSAAASAWKRSLDEARQTQSSRVSLVVELERALESAAGGAATATAELARLHDQAAKLGSAPLRLRAGEGLGAALRRQGSGSEAERVLRATLRLVQDCGGRYAGSYRIHLLLADTLLDSGRGEESRQSLLAAEREVARIAEGLDAEAVASLERLEPIRRLRSLTRETGGQRGTASAAATPPGS